MNFFVLFVCILKLKTGGVQIKVSAYDLMLADVSQQFEAFRKLAQRLGLGHSQGLRLIYTLACSFEGAQTVFALALEKKGY